MPLNWSLAGSPVNPLQALQIMGAEQQRRIDMQRQEQEFGLRQRQIGLQERKYARESRKESIAPLGQAVMDVLRRPEAERAGVWDAYVDQFSANDPSLASYKGQYSEQNLRGLAAEAGVLDDFNKQMTPTIVPLQAGGDYLVKNGLGQVQGEDGNWTTFGPGGAPAPLPMPTGGPEAGEFNKVLDAQQYGQLVQGLGQAGADEWAAKHGFTVAGRPQGETPPPPPGFVLD